MAKTYSWFFGALLAAALPFTSCARTGSDLEAGFKNPPPSARPWVFWFWINGNITKDGITADLEAFKQVGIGGVIWMEVSGPWWAPDGPVTALSPQWHEAFQWALRECARLGLQFDVSVDFGYGSGGPHITPELSMQRLVWTEKEIQGGGPVALTMEKGQFQQPSATWLRPGAKVGTNVLAALEHNDSYRDVAVLAIPMPASAQARDYRIKNLDDKAGLSRKLPREKLAAPPKGAVTPVKKVIDLTPLMDRAGHLQWDAPPGKWLVIRYGHTSNLKMTRPCPSAAVGLECDRLAKAGIEAHFRGFLEKLMDDAGPTAGTALTYVHIDSWEAGGQNWTATFPAEFQSRRGYDPRPWLPVLTGRVIGSADLSERFLWDMRQTVSEMIRENYAARLKELARPYGIKFSVEAYGQLCIDNLAYAGVGDMPISEFWAKGKDLFPVGGSQEGSSKAMASAAHVYGRPVIGAEAFTSDRGWRDTPFTLKAMGDTAFCQGINRFVVHLSAHQAYDNMVPGLTHRKWGQHLQRHNTWWSYSGAWLSYLARCQYLLQQGQPVSDVCYWVGEGAPIGVREIRLTIPEGYDFDFCPAEIVGQLRVADGRLVAPSGTTYRYLLLPDTDRMTPPLARKVRELADAGARIIGRTQPKASPSLTGYPQCDADVAKIGAALWQAKNVTPGKPLAEVFRQDKLAPDFEGTGLRYLHRRIGETDLYFVSHQQNQAQDITCAFRVTGRRPELWNPETGAIRALPEFAESEGRTTIPLHFDPMQSWVVVFRPNARHPSAGERVNFVPPRPLREIGGAWQVKFDPKWGGPDQVVIFEKQTDWRLRPEAGIRYYSGTATYQKSIDLSEAEVSTGRLLLDLGTVEVMARVRLNGKDCGIAWKPPYRVDITDAARAGKNDLDIDVVNLWINRMIGDEQLPDDCHWLDSETLAEWPDWFKSGKPRPSGRYTFTSCKHYTKDTPLVPSGLLGPVTLKGRARSSGW
jgi:hypothetical protein